MNLVFGSQSREIAERLRDSAGNRYPGSKCLPWASDSCPAFALSENADDPVGLASQGKVSLMLIGLINHPGKGLLEQADRDAEHALAAYLSRGLGGIAALNGQFLIAIFDGEEDKLIVVPDSNGLRTAYYFFHEGAVSFATNLATLAEALGPLAGKNETHENFFISHGFFPFGETAFRGIKQIPGHHALVAQGGTFSIEALHVTELKQAADTQSLSSMEESEVIDLLDAAFKQAVQEQLSPDPKVAVLLGGFDSALVAAYLADAGKEVHTYSFYYEDGSFNQAHTDTVAQHIGATHHWVPVDADTIRQGLEAFDRIFNAPTNWLNYVIQTEAVCRAIRADGIRHVYSGDGCDAVFLGYPRVHSTSVLFERLGHWHPKVTNFFTRLLNLAWLENATGRPYPVALHLLRTLSRRMPERGFLTFRIFDGNSVRHLKAPHFRESSVDDETLLKQIAAPLAGKSPDRIAYGGKGFLSPNRSKIVGSSDSTGVVIQAPYLHPAVKSLATNLPDEFCRPSKDTESKVTGKYILMRMAEAKGHLPHEAIYQKKFAAVDAPVDTWLKRDLEAEGKSYLQDLPFDPNEKFCDALFREKLAEKLHRKYIASDNITTHGLSLLLTYSRFTRLIKP
jgi:asparagine synthetase B (glutamine-hydrolysing)